MLALLGAGGYALYSVLTTDPDQGSGSGAAASTTSAGATPSARPHASPASSAAATTGPEQRASVARQPMRAAGATSSSAGPPTLALRVTDSPCFVSISVPGGETLLNETLRRGDTARFDHPELTVTIGDPQAVRLTVNGQPREAGPSGVETFTVSRKD